jgi:fatty acyl-CoA reductase
MLPAYIVDFVMRMIGKKPMFIKLQNKISKSINALEYFTCRSWHFTNENLITLAKAVNPNDGQVGMKKKL